MEHYKKALEHEFSYEDSILYSISFSRSIIAAGYMNELIKLWNFEG